MNEFHCNYNPMLLCRVLSRSTIAIFCLVPALSQKILDFLLWRVRPSTRNFLAGVSRYSLAILGRLAKNGLVSRKRPVRLSSWNKKQAEPEPERPFRVRPNTSRQAVRVLSSRSFFFTLSNHSRNLFLVSRLCERIQILFIRWFGKTRDYK